MRRALAVLVVGLLGGAIAAVIVRENAPEHELVQTAQPPSTEVTETVLVPAAGQTLVSGTVATFSADGAVTDPIPTPFTINAIERGAKNNATVEGALVSGSRKTIYWYAGQPLPVSGAGGAMDLGPAHVDVNAQGVTWLLGGDARAFKPGRYRMSSSVAIGAGGLATPQDGGVEFTADNRTVLTASAGVVLHLPSPALQVDGPGTLRMAGNLTVRTTSGTRTAPSLSMGTGPFRVTLTPSPGGIRVDAILQGPVT